MMTREDWTSLQDVTCCLAVGRFGKFWRVIDRQTWQEIGYACKTRTEAREQAMAREQSTYCDNGKGF
jgi:hypothetical protein